MSTPKLKFRRCRHDIQYSILTLTSIKPTTIKELYDATGVNYRGLKAHIRMMTDVTLIEPVHPDGKLVYSPPTKRRYKVNRKTGEIIPLRVGIMPVRIGEYPYGVTEQGRELLKRMNAISEYVHGLTAFQLSIKDLPRIALKRNRFRKHRTRE
jgi:predicted transcriptional regulator